MCDPNLTIGDMYSVQEKTHYFKRDHDIPDPITPEPPQLPGEDWDMISVILVDRLYSTPRKDRKESLIV